MAFSPLLLGPCATLSSPTSDKILSSCLFWDLAEVLCVGWKPPRTATIFPGPHSVVDVVKGIVPLEWVNTLCGVGLSLAQAKSVARKVGAHIVAVAYKDIWCPQCDAQVLRERSLLVTPKAKSHGRVQAVLPPTVLQFDHVLHTFPMHWQEIVTGVSCPSLIILEEHAPHCCLRPHI